jgi:hypothetical protein
MRKGYYEHDHGTSFPDIGPGLGPVLQKHNLDKPKNPKKDAVLKSTHALIQDMTR